MPEFRVVAIFQDLRLAEFKLQSMNQSQTLRGSHRRIANTDSQANGRIKSGLLTDLCLMEPTARTRPLHMEIGQTPSEKWVIAKGTSTSGLMYLGSSRHERGR
jgi:hypothetical protein